MCNTCYHARITDNGRIVHCRNPYLMDGDSLRREKRYISKPNRPDRYDCEFYESVEDGLKREYAEIKGQGIKEWF